VPPYMTNFTSSSLASTPSNAAPEPPNPAPYIAPSPAVTQQVDTTPKAAPQSEVPVASPTARYTPNTQATHPSSHPTPAVAPQPANTQFQGQSKPPEDGNILSTQNPQDTTPSSANSYGQQYPQPETPPHPAPTIKHRPNPQPAPQNPPTPTTPSPASNNQ
jgi:hypothetical protein